VVVDDPKKKAGGKDLVVEPDIRMITPEPI
jgi:hypothetical protein